MCVCVCPRDDVKTADICFLLGRCVDRKISDEFACQDNRSMSRSFVREFKVTRWCYELICRGCSESPYLTPVLLFMNVNAYAVSILYKLNREKKLYKNEIVHGFKWPEWKSEIINNV